MRLDEFINRCIEDILLEWESIACTVKVSTVASDFDLFRRQTKNLLATIAQQIKTGKIGCHKTAKPFEHDANNDTESPAHTYGMARHLAGVSMDQMISEYRDLRSCILTLWLSSDRVTDDNDIWDIIHFNNAIDEAIIVSISTYEQVVESARGRALGVLGHDLRSPLCAILMAGDLLCQNHSLAKRDIRLASQISASARRANQMVNDLIDLARCNLGFGIPINLKVEQSNFSILIAALVEELSIGFPQSHIVLDVSLAGQGMCDPARIEQVFTNLICNAILHGDSEQPINVELSQNEHYTIFSVKNRGEPISPGLLPNIFEPQAWYSGNLEARRSSSSGLGLGLVIAAEIVKAHGGKIEVVSTVERGTIFTVFLPIY
ncbi:sensor histidine kinase [Pseudomonas kitaguniensis]|uniref:sensor histidine kinase n=1 Tax=Pseudomonas kitaguniensis TaxID=2607908 RepID=UPI003D0250DB